jgi:pimeloyl-ACP methyl ester carboxylesterase
MNAIVKTLKSKLRTTKYFHLAALTATALLLSSCGGNITKLANDNLYPFAKVNSMYSVSDVAPDGLKSMTFDVKSSDGSPMAINAWSYIHGNPNARAIVYLHGNGENLEALRQSGMIDALKSLNAHFVIIDYPGLGRSTGTPNEYNLVHAALAATDWADKTFPNSAIVVWGRSLGAAVATQVAAIEKNKIQGLVITSGWNNFLDAAKALSSLASSIPKEWLALNTYDSAAAAAQVHVTTLMHHGLIDNLIPITLGRKLHEGFADQTNVLFKEIDGKSHNDIFTSPIVWQDIKSFIR